MKDASGTNKKKILLVIILLIGTGFIGFECIKKVPIYWNIEKLLSARRPGEGKHAYETLKKIGMPAVIPLLSTYLRAPYVRGQGRIPQLLYDMRKDSKEILVKEYQERLKQSNLIDAFLIAKILFVNFKESSF